MKISLPKLAALALLLGCSSANSQTLNWGSLTESEIVDSNGATLDNLENVFLFQLGAFEEDFIPDETNVSQWLANWKVFDSASLTNEGDGKYHFLDSRTVEDYNDTESGDYSSAFEGLKGYIWVRNTANTEYFLASASEWTFPTVQECCPTGIHSWSLGDAIVPVWGSIGDNHGGGEYSSPGPYDIQTHAVPEAGSTLLALVACGMTLLRRRRPVLD